MQAFVHFLSDLLVNGTMAGLSLDMEERQILDILRTPDATEPFPAIGGKTLCYPGVSISLDSKHCVSYISFSMLEISAPVDHLLQPFKSIRQSLPRTITHSVLRDALAHLSSDVYMEIPWESISIIYRGISGGEIHVPMDEQVVQQATLYSVDRMGPFLIDV